MYRDVLPGVANLFCAASSVSFEGIDISATGLGESLEEATILHDAELAERKSFILGAQERRRIPVAELSRRDWMIDDHGFAGEREIECVAARNLRSGEKSWVPVHWMSKFGKPTALSAEGTAAAFNEETAALNAVREAIERHASRLWWLGVRAPSRPSDTAEALFSRYQAHWCRDHDRRSGLLDITPDAGVPVYAAWSCRTNGHDLCFGTACHPIEKQAIRSALKELLQMEFGLDVVHYRCQNSVNLSDREEVMLARARQLKFDDCATLLNATGTPTECAQFDELADVPVLAEHLYAHLKRAGVSAHGVLLAQSDPVHQVVHAVLPALGVAPRPSASENACRSWTEWDLY